MLMAVPCEQVREEPPFSCKSCWNSMCEFLCFQTEGVGDVNARYLSSRARVVVFGRVWGLWFPT